VERDIRERLGAYLQGEITLVDFREWLSDQTWDNPDAPKVAHAIEYVIDEAALGNLSRSQMDAALRELVAQRAHELV
jgi:hypothetical protein